MPKQINLHEGVVLDKIQWIRNEKVIMDKDLAELYGVSTKVLKQAVRRNFSRFPDDFMFELTKEENKYLRSQIVTSNWGGNRYLPMVFTEKGIAMLSSVLKSEAAIQVNIRIMRVFSRFSSILKSQKEIMQKIEHINLKDIEQDKKIALIFKYLKELEKLRNQENSKENRTMIGFKPYKKT